MQSVFPSLALMFVASCLFCWMFKLNMQIVTQNGCFWNEWLSDTVTYCTHFSFFSFHPTMKSRKANSKQPATLRRQHSDFASRDFTKSDWLMDWFLPSFLLSFILSETTTKPEHKMDKIYYMVGISQAFLTISWVITEKVKLILQ